MKKGLLIAMLIATLTGCSSKSGEEILENKYQDCTVETCSKEMLIDRIEVAATTTDGYKGESKDAEEALVKLYGVTYKEVKELKNLQFAVDSLEEGTLKEDCSEYCYYVDRYVKAISECGGKCNSEFITYEEIKDLPIDEAINLAKEKREEYNANNSSISSNSVTDSTSNNQNSLEQEAEEYFASVSGVNLNRFEGITPNYDDYEYVTSKYCFNKKGTLQSETKTGSTTYQIYSWDGDEGGIVTISFIDGVVSSKTQVGLK